jgi:hypothetical protein
MPTIFSDLLKEFADAARSNRDKGDLFERLMANYRVTDYGLFCWKMAKPFTMPFSTGIFGSQAMKIKYQDFRFSSFPRQR